jgi:hypothetical protein
MRLLTPRTVELVLRNLEQPGFLSPGAGKDKTVMGIYFHVSWPSSFA